MNHFLEEKKAKACLFFLRLMKYFVPLIIIKTSIKPLSTNPEKWSNTICLSVFDHFMNLALKRLILHAQ